MTSYSFKKCESCDFGQILFWHLMKMPRSAESIIIFQRISMTGRRVGRGEKEQELLGKRGLFLPWVPLQEPQDALWHLFLSLPLSSFLAGWWTVWCRDPKGELSLEWSILDISERHFQKETEKHSNSSLMSPKWLNPKYWMLPLENLVLVNMREKKLQTQWVRPRWRAKSLQNYTSWKSSLVSEHKG